MPSSHPAITSPMPTTPPATVLRPTITAQGQLLRPSPAYAPLAGCTTWNTAYAMHEMAGKYECEAMYKPGSLTAYRFSVFRDAHGLAYTTNSLGQWQRNPSYDGYVAGVQPHR